MKRMIVGVALLLAGCALAGNVVVRDGERTWTFAEVNGTSRLPLNCFRGGADRDRIEDVTLSRYWIAERMVTEGDFAEVMGRPVREGQNATNLLTMIEWEEARIFCERFTKRYAAQFPTNCIASMPTAIEWAHAVCVLDGRVDLWDRAGTFLFARSSEHTYLHTLWKDAKRMENPKESLATDLPFVMSRQKVPFLGLRMVLIDVTRGMTADYHPILWRATTVLLSGQFEAAQPYLTLAITRGHLASNDLEWCENALAVCRKEREEDHEDWSGLVARSAAFAERRGYEIEPFANAWMYHGRGKASADCAAAYERAGITGSFVRIGDLPIGVAAKQNAVVQVLSCDFSGDGRKDLVVETYGAVGSDGYWYGFYRQLPNGSYTNVYNAQVVGLCTLPKKDGGACGFLVVNKLSNPVLNVRLLTFEGGEAQLTAANMRPFSMVDVEVNKVYMRAPFIGAGYGLGWRILEGRGFWYRPLFWPWRQGEVQGCEPAND